MAKETLPQGNKAKGNRERHLTTGLQTFAYVNTGCVYLICLPTRGQRQREDEEREGRKGERERTERIGRKTNTH